MTLTVGSLFAGVGGLDLGLERAGMKVLWQVEKDPYAQKVLRKHWPDVRLHDDVEWVHGPPKREYGCDGCLEPVDLICGGFPCTNISVAGKGEGIAGPESGLWKEYARIIDEVRPTWVVVENVPALRSRGLGVVLSDLSTLGYDAWWDCFPASSFGAPHQRDRIFVVAYPVGKPGIARGKGDAVQSERGRDTDRGPQQQNGLVGPEQHPWVAEPGVGRISNGVPNLVDRLRCLGNAVVPQVAEHVGRLIVAAHGAGK